jgi:Tol biopolymer transport system component
MKIAVILLLTPAFLLASQWQPPLPCQPSGISFNGPSFNASNNRIYCYIFNGSNHADIAMYDFIGSQWVYAGLLPGDVNTVFDDEEPFITYDGQHIYFQRSAFAYQLYVADWDGSGFTNATRLNDRINKGDTRYPSLTQDGQKLYFDRITPNGRKIFESTWEGDDWGEPVLLPVAVNGTDSQDRIDVTISPDGNEIYFTGAGTNSNWLAFSRKVNGVWQPWQYCDSNINQSGEIILDEALTYAPYATQELLFRRDGVYSLHALRSPIAVEPATLSAIKALYAR